MIVDYKVHYVKKSGKTQPKVFKLKEIELPARELLTISKKQPFQDLSTRVHYPGRHAIELMVNGRSLARETFELRVETLKH